MTQQVGRQINVLRSLNNCHGRLFNEEINALSQIYLCSQVDNKENDPLSLVQDVKIITGEEDWKEKALPSLESLEKLSPKDRELAFCVSTDGKTWYIYASAQKTILEIREELNQKIANSPHRPIYALNTNGDKYYVYGSKLRDDGNVYLLLMPKTNK